LITTDIHQQPNLSADKVKIVCRHTKEDWRRNKKLGKKAKLIYNAFII
jgi:hypothetical protein